MGGRVVVVLVHEAPWSFLAVWGLFSGKRCCRRSADCWVHLLCKQQGAGLLSVGIAWKEPSLGRCSGGSANVIRWLQRWLYREESEKNIHYSFQNHLSCFTFINILTRLTRASGVSGLSYMIHLVPLCNKDIENWNQLFPSSKIPRHNLVPLILFVTRLNTGVRVSVASQNIINTGA